ncbi:MAG: hypothetical protein IMF06_02020 [Proteobacteria bacterium]|nr:hypothetical protein [Pseudomonadota bacterium]
MRFHLELNPVEDAGINSQQISEEELHNCAQLLADQQLPAGWQVVASSGFAHVAHNSELQVFYKEFLPRSPVEKIKALIKGSRATRARKHSEALLKAGFNAPQNLAWGQLPGAREYLFTRAVAGAGVSTWIKSKLPRQEAVELQERRKFLRELGVFIGRLHGTGFIHGDLRTSNILAHRGIEHFEFSLIDNERNVQYRPPPGKLMLKNLMQLNMHTPAELGRSDRLRFFHSWHSQIRELSPLEAKLIAIESYQWAMRRLHAKGKL